MVFPACASTARAPDGKAASADPSDHSDAAVPSFADAGSGPPPGGCIPDPGAFEVAGNACDDDDDGIVDNVAIACDGSLLETAGAEDFARALGICHQVTGASDPKWGLVSATYRRGFNDPSSPADGQHGILTKFGDAVKPREGHALGVLSSGWAREYDAPPGGTPLNPTGAFKLGSFMGNPLVADLPPGYPKPAQGCPIPQRVYDVAVARLEIKTPTNALGLQIDLDFFSGEWPEWVCSPYNDGFVAYLKSKAFNGGQADNISFDSLGNPVSVNNVFFEECTSGAVVGCCSKHLNENCRSGTASGNGVANCPGGPSELRGTGFEAEGTYCGGKKSTGGGATGWLTSTAPVQGGETIVLEFYVWDSMDGNFNSSVLLDNLRWVPKPVTVSTDRPPIK